MTRVLLGLCLATLWTVAALAQERITSFDVVIDVETDGDIVVTETIDVISEGIDIQRGIFRELPAKYTFMGVTQDYHYELLGVTRDDQPEAVSTFSSGNAITFRLGRRDVFLENGPHQYVIRYRVPNEVRSQEDMDEVYWNATGNYWAFPIERASATINFPDGSNIVELEAYTGRLNAEGDDFISDQRDSSVFFQTTRPLEYREGLTVAASIDQGVIDPLPPERIRELWWIRNGGAIVLAVGSLGLLLYYLLMWKRIGRDPVKPPVFARYEPPRGYSPGGVHTIYHRTLKKKDWLTSMLMKLSTEGYLDIEAEKKKTTITQLKPVPNEADAKELIKRLKLSPGDKIVMDGKSDSSLFKGVLKFGSYLMKKYGRDYYRSNFGWTFLGIAASVALVLYVFIGPVAKTPLTTVLMLGLAAMNAVFIWLMPAPTEKGADIRAEIEGFKLYLETAEEKRINTANPLGQTQPAMSLELYERFLPYAVALGVEKPWTKYFETVMPKEAKEYRPSYARGSQIESGRNPLDFGKTLNKALTAGVAAAAPVSQSSGGGFSSGSGGGGFSGGGGGGGGGGGW